MPKPANIRSTLTSPSERPDLYDGYDGMQHSAANPVRVPERLAKLLDERRSRTSDTSDIARSAIRSLKENAAEMRQMLESILEQMHQAVEELRVAKTMDEIVSIRASYLRQTSANTADYTHRFAELMVPMEFAMQAQGASTEDAAVASKPTKQTGSAL